MDDEAYVPDPHPRRTVYVRMRRSIFAASEPTVAEESAGFRNAALGMRHVNFGAVGRTQASDGE
jgi:hypothetical protein